MVVLLEKISRIPFVSQAIADKADLRAFRQKPSLRIIAGVSLIILSFVLGWPLITLLGAMSVYLGNPWIVAAGGPVVYGLSHLIFMAGMYLSGAEYTVIFLRWLTRVAMESLMTRFRI